MKKRVYWVIACLPFLFTGCSYTKYSYPNEPMNYTVVASADSQQASEHKALQMAASVCGRKGLDGQINGVYKVSNLYLANVKKTSTQYYFAPGKTQDYLTVVDLTCVQPVVAHKK